MAIQPRNSWRIASFLLVMLAGCARQPVPPLNEIASAGRLMTPEDLTALPSRAPDRRIAYGVDTSQYGELRIPAGAGPHPLVVLIHGGCFKAAYATAHYFGAMADALKADGIATWNIEYRRLPRPANLIVARREGGGERSGIEQRRYTD